MTTDNPFKRENYKFGTEGFLSMFLSKYQFVLGADLENYSKSNALFNKENPCNIYFVLQRPKVTIDPNSFKSTGKIAKFDFIIHERDSKRLINVVTELSNAKSEIQLHTQYPFNFFALTDKTETLFVARPSSMIDSSLVQNNVLTDILDYEILYIGQAYGTDGKRTALDRLSSHETVQKIYTHALTNYPESDIWILLTNFSQLSMLFSGGVDEELYDEKHQVRDEKLIDNFLENKGLHFTEKQKINFTEAALIKMFEPKYNKDFKDNFPSEKHSSYSECYSLDLRALTIELNTYEMTRKLYTEKTGRKVYHSEMFEFKNDSDRISLLGMYK